MPLIMANKFFRGVNLANFTCCLHLGVADSSSKVEELEDKVSQLEAARDELEVSVTKKMLLFQENLPPSLTAFLTLHKNLAVKNYIRTD